MGSVSASTRRSFLKRSTQGAAALAAPWIIRPSALGLGRTVAPSDRITLGLIGCGDHGTGWNLDQIFRNDDSQVIAVCDVDKSHVERARQRVDAHYQEKYGAGYRACTTHHDFRELLRRDDIDAVAICTPDHWHVLPALMAVQAGKDVICEKPLTLFVAEGRHLSDTVAQTGRIFQTASENRSIDSYIRMCELVRNGRIGTLKHMEVKLPGGNEERGDKFSDRQVQPVPPELDYEMWQGQAPVQPYIPARVHMSFRWCSRYSGGRITDWGAHLIDLAQWANDSERTGPVAIEGQGTFPAPDDIYDTATAFNVNYRYANGVTMAVTSDGPGIRLHGTDGWIGFDGWRAPLQASDPKILDSVIGPNEIHLHRPRVVIPREYGNQGGEHRDFIDCVKSRQPCYAPAEIGHRTITVAHLGNIAMRLKRPLKWDPDTERFVDDTEADAMLTRPQREPWAMANVDGWLNA